MLGVLTAKSADEPAPLAPSDHHGVHVATFPTRELAPEELPTLPIRTSSPVAALAQLARVTTKLREPGAVVRDQLPQADLESVLHGGGDRREVTVLDKLFELALARRGKLHDARACRAGLSEKAADDLRAVREVPVGPQLFEPALLLGAETYPEKAARRRFVRFWHFV